MRIELKAILLLIISVFGGVTVLVACDKNEGKNEGQWVPSQVKPEAQPEAESSEPAAPTFAGLTLVRAGVYDSGKGEAVIVTSEQGDASKALTQLIGRRQCWRDRFPERFKKVQTESLAHRTIKEVRGNSAWGNVVPYAFVITYGVE